MEGEWWGGVGKERILTKGEENSSETVILISDLGTFSHLDSVTPIPVLSINTGPAG
jgi:hypothetical protein